jgi:hypothetical protein
MKINIKYFAILFICTFFVSCFDEEKSNEILKGETLKFDMKQIKLNNNKEISGSCFFVLGFGGGSIKSENEKFYFYAKMVNNNYVLCSIDVKYVIIIEDGSNCVEIDRSGYNCFIRNRFLEDSMFERCNGINSVHNHMIMLHVPKNSIAFDYKIDLKGN